LITGKPKGDLKHREILSWQTGIDDKKWNKWKEEGWIIKIK
jgi:hypothetical protein